MGSKLQPLELTKDEIEILRGWVTRRSTAQGLAKRARIVLACAEGRSNTAGAAQLGVSRTTVNKWRARFLRRRLDGLCDEPRPGVPRTITNAKVEEVVVRTLEEVPEGSTHWSKRELAKRVGISSPSVHRIWRAFGLQPHRVEEFKISPDPLLIDKIRDVVALDLLAWMPMLALTGKTRRWEPKRLRLRLFSAAAQFVNTGRRHWLRFTARWPWTDVITHAIARLHILPTPG